jgi:hypothetical protein
MREVAGPHEAEGLVAVEDLAARLEVQAGLGVLHRAGQAHAHAADVVDHADQPAEADAHVVVTGSPVTFCTVCTSSFGPPTRTPR